MTVRLTVDERAWAAHVDEVAAADPTLVPVVKGNGYGFGRARLMPHAARLADTIAVGTVHEAADVPADRTPLVLTPALHLPPDLPRGAVLTVGSTTHVDALTAAGWRGRVVVKLASSMHRYGVARTTSPIGTAALPVLLDACHRAGLDVAAAAIHLGLAGDDHSRAAEVRAWLPELPDHLPLSVSHLGPTSLAVLRATAHGRPIRRRVGTGLWHGDKSTLHLGADVLDVHAVAAGATAGYRATAVPGDGWLLVVGAGSAHGVAPLDDGRSPFHHARRRVALLEAPHMHTTMLFLPASDGPPPAVGRWLDLQRPLITTAVDEVRWA